MTKNPVDKPVVSPSVSEINSAQITAITQKVQSALSEAQKSAPHLKWSARHVQDGRHIELTVTVPTELNRSE